MSREFEQYIGMTGKPTVSPPVESDMIRRFSQAIMDNDPTYYDEEYARQSKFGAVVAPPLFPLHVLRRRPGTPDPLQSVIDNPDADGSADAGAVLAELPAVPTPLKRRLNGGSEIEFYRCVRLGERVVATPRYHSITAKKSKGADMLVIVTETRFTTEGGDLLVISRQTSLRR
ncbi:MAG: MaoC family dehydratase N-terminal domain-containing protein [Nevskiales bacterium]